MQLTEKNVEVTLAECLVHKEEYNVEALVVEGISATFGFHPERLQKQHNNIADMLGELPRQFKEAESIVNGCFDQQGVQWARYQGQVEALFVLGLATDQVEWLADRAIWPLLPGQMPYFRVTPRKLAIILNPNFKAKVPKQ